MVSVKGTMLIGVAFLKGIYMQPTRNTGPKGDQTHI